MILLTSHLLQNTRGQRHVESLDRGSLQAPEAAAPLRAVIDELTRLLGGERIELSAEG